MHIIVCIKTVVTEAPRGKIVRSPDRCVLNPFDRPALAVALAMKASGGGTVTAVSMGPPVAESGLREAIAMGADRALLVCDPALAGSDTLATATALGAAAAYLAPFDLLLFGTRTADSDTGQVGPQCAVLLDIPVITNAVRVAGQRDTLRVDRSVDGFEEIYELRMPAALTIHPAASAQMDPSLGGIAEAFDDRRVEKVGIDALGIDAKQVGESGSPTRVLSMQPIHRKRTCDWIDGSPADQADALVRRLLAAGLIQ